MTVILKPSLSFFVPLLATALACFAPVHAGATSEPVQLSFHIAAHPAHDRELIDVAAHASTDVVVDGTPVARWVPVPAHRAAELASNDELVLRNDDSELLVLLSANDVSEADLLQAMSSSDAYGKPAVALTLKEAGAERMWQLSSENVGRDLAVVLDGQVHQVPRLHSAIRGNLMISDLPDEAAAQRLMDRLRAHHLAPATITAQEMLPLIIFGVVVLLLVLIVAGVLVLALLPAPGYQPTAASWAWSVVGGGAGLLIGALCFGVDYHTGLGAPSGSAVVVEQTLTISLLGLVLGSLSGTLAGIVLLRLLRRVLRRAVFNARRIWSGKARAPNTARAA